MRRFVFAAFFIFLICFCFSACKEVPASTPGNTIAGKWHDEADLTKFEFTQDGTVKVTAMNMGTLTGTYEAEDGKLTLRYSGVLQEVSDSYDYRLEDGKLYLEDQEFIRVQ